MSNTISSMVSGQERQRLRKVRNREEPEAQRAIAVIYKGARPGSVPGVTVQFNEDLRLDGLWGALLSAEDYEEQVHFVIDTVKNALEAALNRNVG